MQHPTAVVFEMEMSNGVYRSTTLHTRHTARRVSRRNALGALNNGRAALMAMALRPLSGLHAG